MNMKNIKKNKKLKKKYRRLLRKIIRFIFLVCFLSIILLFLYLIFGGFNAPVKDERIVKSFNYEDNKIILKTRKHEKELYCILSENTPTLDINNYKLYIKTDDKIIYSGENDKAVYLEVNENKNKIYLAINGTYNFYNKIIGNSKSIKVSNTNSEIASISDNGIIKGIKPGTTTISVKYNKKEYKIEVLVTNLITVKPTGGYDYKKGYLACNKYSKEDNDLIDEILKDRINTVGYKTRAGAVEAARFLTLEFPYRINYFYENGRQTTNNVDGEGRYYNVGFYLDSSRYKNITGSSTGPKAWGCSMYSNPAHRNIDNGLDCSGFVSWALLNAGFDVKDVGAGFSDNSDLTDFGELKSLTTTLAKSDKIKVGDLLHSYAAGGHIGIIVGIDSNYYYVAQALWYDEIGVVITKYKKSSLPSSFPHVILMDKYYKEDGNLTNMW